MGPGEREPCPLTVECPITALKPHAYTVSQEGSSSLGRGLKHPVPGSSDAHRCPRREGACCWLRAPAGEQTSPERAREDSPRGQGPQRVCAVHSCVPCGPPASSGLQHQRGRVFQRLAGSRGRQGERLGAWRTPVGGKGRAVRRTVAQCQKASPALLASHGSPAVLPRRLTCRPVSVRPLLCSAIDGPWWEVWPHCGEWGGFRAQPRGSLSWRS